MANTDYFGYVGKTNMRLNSVNYFVMLTWCCGSMSCFVWVVRCLEWALLWLCVICCAAYLLSIAHFGIFLITNDDWNRAQENEVLAKLISVWAQTRCLTKCTQLVLHAATSRTVLRQSNDVDKVSEEFLAVLIQRAPYTYQYACVYFPWPAQKWRNIPLLSIKNTNVLLSTSFCCGVINMRNTL